MECSPTHEGSLRKRRMFVTIDEWWWFGLKRQHLVRKRHTYSFTYRNIWNVFSLVRETETNCGSHKSSLLRFQVIYLKITNTLSFFSFPFFLLCILIMIHRSWLSPPSISAHSLFPPSVPLFFPSRNARPNAIWCSKLDDLQESLINSVSSILLISRHTDTPDGLLDLDIRFFLLKPHIFNDVVILLWANSQIPPQKKVVLRLLSLPGHHHGLTDFLNLLSLDFSLSHHH